MRTRPSASANSRSESPDTRLEVRLDHPQPRSTRKLAEVRGVDPTVLMEPELRVLQEHARVRNSVVTMQAGRC
jgi:hypothetical protein